MRLVAAPTFEELLHEYWNVGSANTGNTLEQQIQEMCNTNTGEIEVNCCRNTGWTPRQYTSIIVQRIRRNTDRNAKGKQG